MNTYLIGYRDIRDRKDYESIVDADSVHTILVILKNLDFQVRNIKII